MSIKNYSKEVSCNNVYQLDIQRAFPTYLEKKKNIKLSDEKEKYKIEIGKLLKDNTELRNEIVEYIYNSFLSLLDKYNLCENDIIRFYVDEIIITKPIIHSNEILIEHDIFVIKQKKIKKYIFSRMINSGFVKIFYNNKIKIDKKTLLPYANDFILDLYNSINKRFIVNKYISGNYPCENYITNYRKNNVVIFNSGVYIDSSVYNHIIDRINLDKRIYYNIAKIYNFLLQK